MACLASITLAEAARSVLNTTEGGKVDFANANRTGGIDSPSRHSSSLLDSSSNSSDTDGSAALRGHGTRDSHSICCCRAIDTCFKGNHEDVLKVQFNLAGIRYCCKPRYSKTDPHCDEDSWIKTGKYKIPVSEINPRYNPTNCDLLEQWRQWP